MSIVDFLGFLAAALTTGSFVPQVWKTLKTRDTSSISLAMYLMFVAGVASWFAWGIAAHQWPVILANGVTLILSATVLAFKVFDVVMGKEKP
jgi:MtN3 and saliva related transmembrane protein